MDCERIRIRISEDPASGDAEVERHVAGCAGCAAFLTRAIEAERRIQAALRFDVEALKARGSREAVAPKHRRAALFGVAASLVAVLAVWAVSSLSPNGDTAAFAQQLAEHWYEEPASWVRSDVPVSAAVLEAALDGQARVDPGALGPVTYARSCLVAGQWVPHLVLQGRSGPVMLLLLPARRVEAVVPLALPGQGLGGRLLPYQGGGVAILGEDAESLEEIERRVAGAVQWTI